MWMFLLAVFDCSIKGFFVCLFVVFFFFALLRFNWRCSGNIASVSRQERHTVKTQLRKIQTLTGRKKKKGIY